MRFFALVLIMAACCATPVHAAIYRVGTGAGCTHATVQSAIDAAVASAPDDEIRISGSAYTNQALHINAAEGRIALLGGHADCGAPEPTAGARTMLSGTATQSVLRISGSIDVKLWNLDIQNGHSADQGGGIRFSSTVAASLDLLNTLVRNNTAAEGGGGIAIENGNPTATPEQVSLSLRGNSNVLGNTVTNPGTGAGGGILCLRASVKITGNGHVSQNRSEAFGGGIHADNCRVEIGSRGVAGAVLWANQAEIGGALSVRGLQSTVDIYPADATLPARVLGNRARQGSALMIRNGPYVRLFDTNLEQNAESNYGAVWVSSVGPAPAGTSLFVMQGGIQGAPPGAVACADAEACNRISGSDGNDGFASAVLVRADPEQPLGAMAFLRGTRFEANTRADALLAVSLGLLDVNGAVIVGNTTYTLVDGAEGTLTIAASTIAGNAFRSGQAVVYARGDCDAADGQTRIERSIVWQPGMRLIDTDSAFPLQPECFQHLVGNDFGALPAAPERLVADPQFIDPAAGVWRLSPSSPALDFAPSHEDDSTRDHGRRVFDLPGLPNRFGPQDLGAYERITDGIFDDGFDCENC